MVKQDIGTLPKVPDFPYQVAAPTRLIGALSLSGASPTDGYFASTRFWTFHNKTKPPRRPKDGRAIERRRRRRKGRRKPPDLEERWWWRRARWGPWRAPCWTTSSGGLSTAAGAAAGNRSNSRSPRSGNYASRPSGSSSPSPTSSISVPLSRSAVCFIPHLSFDFFLILYLQLLPLMVLLIECDVVLWKN